MASLLKTTRAATWQRDKTLGFQRMAIVSATVAIANNSTLQTNGVYRTHTRFQTLQTKTEA
eukprot:8342394-Lingulodinium_polyedra.AAC.1